MLADPVDQARLALLGYLARRGYRFAAPAPSSHHRILWRRGWRSGTDLADVLGWNMPFREGKPFADLVKLLHRAQMLERRGGRLRSWLRVASVGPLLFLHSGLRTAGQDAVFFGPDSYRFAAFIRAHMPTLRPGATILDIGAGAGVGGVFAHSLAPQASLTLTDVNPNALALARVNAAFADQTLRLLQGEGLAGAEGLFDLIVANPPYLGGSGKTYSEGGGPLGLSLSLDWTHQALRRLKPGGRMLLYTGAPFVRGQDLLRPSLEAISREAGCVMDYEPLDPDVFPSTLLHRAYWRVERIAAVGAVMIRRPLHGNLGAALA